MLLIEELRLLGALYSARVKAGILPYLPKKRLYAIFLLTDSNIYLRM